MDGVLDVQFGRGKVTFRSETAKRLMTWKLTNEMDTDTLLDVMEDILSELRYPNGYSTRALTQYQITEDSLTYSDKVVGSPHPSDVVVGGSIDL